MVTVIQADVTNETAMKQVFRQIEAQHGRLDFLINNAGGDTMSAIETLDSELL